METQKDVVVTQLEATEEVVEEVVDEEVEVEEETAEEVTEDTQTEENTSEKVEEKPKKQSSAERKRYAEMRRAKEAKEREKAIQKAKQEGIIEGLGGINPYTGEKMVDDIDFELYQEMKDAESKGYNPNNMSDMLKYRKGVKQEALQREQAQQQADLNTQNDIRDFQEKNPNVSVKELLNNKDFQIYADGLLGQVPLATIYAKYNHSKNEASKQAEEIVLNEQARRVSSAGSLTTGDDVGSSLTIEQISKMSREEIEANYDKIMDSYFKK